MDDKQGVIFIEAMMKTIDAMAEACIEDIVKGEFKKHGIELLNYKLSEEYKDTVSGRMRQITGYILQMSNTLARIMEKKDE